ncbi:MAG: glycosyltransferase family A protein [Patescibacteria group bacterium]
MKVSFVIPAHNEEKYIGECIESIFETRKGFEDATEVIVIDNASSDNTKKVSGKYPGVRVIPEPIKGLTRARQRGLIEATGDLIAYIDADSRVPAHWLHIALKEFSLRPNMVCLSGPFRYHDLQWFDKTIAETCWYLFAPITYRLIGYMILGANFIAKKEAIEKIGGFDTGIDFYGEDTNIARRLSKIGKVVFKMKFFIYGSGRRLRDHGILRSFIKYGLNFIWEVLFHKPFTRKYKDIR